MQVPSALLSLAVILALPLAAAPTAPVDPGAAVSSHAPYLAGECALCHVRASAQDPGPASQPMDARCLDCHDDVGGIELAPRSHHPANDQACMGCHNPHNALSPGLLLPGVTTPRVR